MKMLLKTLIGKISVILLLTAKTESSDEAVLEKKQTLQKEPMEHKEANEPVTKARDNDDINMDVLPNVLNNPKRYYQGPSVFKRLMSSEMKRWKSFPTIFKRIYSYYYSPNLIGKSSVLPYDRKEYNSPFIF